MLILSDLPVLGCLMGIAPRSVSNSWHFFCAYLPQRQAVGERPYVRPGAAAPADGLGPVVGPGDGLLEVLGWRHAVKDPVRRLPVADLGVDPDRVGAEDVSGLLKRDVSR